MGASIVERLKPVFVVGSAKSGTTFLLSLFDSHPSVLALHETATYSIPEKVISGGEGRVAEWLCARQEPAGSRLFVRAFRDRRRQVADGEQSESLARSGLCAFVERAAAAREPAAKRLSHFVEKTPNHYRSANQIFEDFPSANILHVIRDPRDNFLALKRRMFDPESAHFGDPGYHPIAFVNDRLLQSYTAAYDNVQRYPERYRVLFYEDLVIGGEETVRRVSHWLGLSWYDALLVPSRDGELWQGNSFAPDLKGDLAPFDRRPIGRWVAGLSSREIALMEHVIRSFGMMTKYPPHETPRLVTLRTLLWPMAGEVSLLGAHLVRSRFSPRRLASITYSYVKGRFDSLRVVGSARRDDRLIRHSI